VAENCTTLPVENCTGYRLKNCNWYSWERRSLEPWVPLNELIPEKYIKPTGTVGRDGTGIFKLTGAHPAEGRGW